MSLLKSTSWPAALVFLALAGGERDQVERFLAAMAEAYGAGDRESFRGNFDQGGEMSAADFAALGRVPFWTWSVEEVGTEEGGLWARLIPQPGKPARLTIHLVRGADGRLRMKAPGERPSGPALARAGTVHRPRLGLVSLSFAEQEGLLLLRLDFQPEALRFNWSQRFLFLDADGNPETGASIHELGVKGIEWSFLLYHTAPVAGEAVGFGLTAELLTPGVYPSWDATVATADEAWHQLNHPQVISHRDSSLELRLPSVLLLGPEAQRLRWVLVGSAPGELIESVQELTEAKPHGALLHRGASATALSSKAEAPFRELKKWSRRAWRV